jgi:hypothetical protein
MLDNSTPLVLLDYHNNWYLFEIHGYDTWSHIGRCTLFGILVDAHGWHGWHIGKCTWLEYWYMHMLAYG